MSYNWGIFLARGRTRTQYSTVCRRQSRPRASHWSDPADVATQSATIQQPGQLTKCARVSYKRILTVRDHHVNATGLDRSLVQRTRGNRSSKAIYWRLRRVAPAPKPPPPARCCTEADPVERRWPHDLSGRARAGCTVRQSCLRPAWCGNLPSAPLVGGGDARAPPPGRRPPPTPPPAGGGAPPLAPFIDQAR